MFLTTVFLLAIKFSRGSECYIWGNMFWWMAGGSLSGWNGGGGDQSWADLLTDRPIISLSARDVLME